MRRTHAVLLAVVVAAAAAGCDSIAARRPPGSRLDPDIFQDVPAPGGARYVDDHSESFSYRGGTFRSGRFEFLYDGAVPETLDFYRRTMTASPYDWVLKHENPGEPGATLVFSKNRDRATVDVSPVPPGPGEKASSEVRILVRVNFRRD